MEPTKSFWLNNAPYQDYRSTPDLPQTAEVVVIGGGITGVSTAYWLRKNGVEVTLVERRGLSGGATGRNGGHISPGTGERFSESVKRYGIAIARAVWDYSHQTAEGVRAFVAEHGVACELRFNGSVSLALHPEELPLVQESAEEMAKYNLGGEYWDAATCAERTRSEDFLGGIYRPTAGQLWPAKLVFAVAEQAIRLGANVQTQTAVQAVERTDGGLTVKTDRGEIQAQQVVHATNAWTRHLLPFLEGKITPVRGQVIVTEPAPRLWNFGLSTNFGYEYFMQRPDRRIVLGGMRWLTPSIEVGTDDDTVVEPTVSKGLHEFLPLHFHDLRGLRVEQEWTGIMGFSADRNPLIGPLPDRPGEYVAAGFTGHGMPMTFYAGKAIAEMIAGKEPEFFVPEAFLPARFAD
ncbi:MAG: FAD-binding oxidoreductase [Chloroflexi bacterium]|nr:FAD-binding oxidoreductase [Chloroflexota bacterium]MBI3732500.1 FAD-binding oxidoreductase [Chloroflexota bacterium]